jgi:hypothetical protein
MRQRDLKVIAMMMLAGLAIPSSSQVLQGSPGLCPTGSNFSTSGSWNTAPSMQDHFTVSWQEQSCGNNGISAYALDVMVTGPKGVKPF